MSDLKSLRQHLRLFGAFVAAVAALMGPAIYCASAYIQEADELSFKAELNASRVAKYIYAHGSLWTFHRVRLLELIELHRNDSGLNQRIYSGPKKLVAELGDPSATPTIMRSAPIIVADEVVGRIELSTTAQPLIVKTMLAAAGSATLSLLIYFLLSKLRLGLLDSALKRLGQREEQLFHQNAQFSAALENMSQGLCMFDGELRLIVCNADYATMYGLSNSDASPGTPLRTILEHCVATGNCPENSKNFVEDRIRQILAREAHTTEMQLLKGRIISVFYQPMSNGGWVERHSDVTEKRRAEKQLEYLAHHDSLTELPNRVQLRAFIEQNLPYAQRGSAFAVHCLDLDHFKNVNDTLGHPVGDALLRAVADRLRKLLRETDLVARTGGDEFSIVQTELDADLLAPASLAERVIEAISAPFNLGDHEIVIGTSVGIAIAPDDGNDADDLLKNADMALYRAKDQGRGSFHFFEDDMNAKAQARRILELDLRKAIAAGEFELHYQPLVNLAENEITGFEALVRWNHPIRGRVPPDQFIPLAEETGLIVQIGEWVLRRACAEAKTWPSDLRIAVNVSPMQFRNKNLVATVMSALAASGLPSNRLELEITEALLLQNNDATLTVMHNLRNLGVRISMDDFGTGYSSLGYLQKFPFDKIKIDQSFVGGLIASPQSIGIIRAVVQLGHSFGMTTTAEGVETQTQLDQMRSEGCTEVQGYFYAKPMPASEIGQLLSSFQTRAQAVA